jgi:tight adherence protein B
MIQAMVAAGPSGRWRTVSGVDELRSPGPRAIVLAAAAFGVLFSFALRTPMPFFLLPSTAAVLVVRRGRRRRWAEHDAQRDAITALCTALRAELEAGLQPRSAFVSAVWSRRELRDLAEDVSRPGTDLDLPRLLAEHARRPGRQALRALAACWFAAERHGLALADAVAGIEEGLRAEHSRLRAVEVELAGIRATILLLAALPAFGLALGLTLGADPLEMLLHRPVGQIGLVLGIALDLVGLVWTDRLVESLRPEESFLRSGRVRAA